MPSSSLLAIVAVAISVFCCDAFALTGSHLTAARASLRVRSSCSLRMMSDDGKTSNYLDNLSQPAGKSGKNYLDQIDEIGGTTESPTGNYLNNLASDNQVGTGGTGKENYLDVITDSSTVAPSTTAAAAAVSDDAAATDSSSSDESASTAATTDADPEAAQAAKDALLRACLGTNRGFSCRREERRTISSMIKELEALNPNASPTDGFDTGSSPLTGEWQLLFTDALDVLSLGLLPGISIGQIYQNIGSDGTEIQNIVELQPILAPLLPSTVAELKVKAKGSVSSPVRLNLSFEAASFTPLTFLGRQVEEKLKPLMLKFPSKLRNVGWLDHTYIDEDIRVARALGGSAFVLLKVKKNEEQW